jgi:hypothetical protein
MAFPVKWIHSGMRGAPQISGTPATLIAALDAFLLNGFGQVTALSVTVSGGIATATLNSGQSFDKHTVVLVEGATTPAALNGEARVLGATSSSITWATTAPDGAATGVITIKVAPVGSWEKAFSGSNLAVYRSTDPASAKFCYRVEDSGTTVARLRGFETMSDGDTGSGLFPTDAQISGGGYLQKSTAANATAVYYHLVADSRTVLMAVAAASSGNATYLAAPVRGFGDMLPVAQGGDAWSAAISCTTTSTQSNSSGAFDASSVGSPSIYMARVFGGASGSTIATSLTAVGAVDSGSSGNDGSFGALGASIDGRLWYGRRLLRNGTAAAGPVRAEVPGLLHIPQSGVLSSIPAGSVIGGAGEYAGRLLLATANRTSGGGLASTPDGVNLIDISGPWR